MLKTGLLKRVEDIHAHVYDLEIEDSLNLLDDLINDLRNDQETAC